MSHLELLAVNVTLTITIFADSMRWCVSNEHDHLSGMLPPVHGQRLVQPRRNRLRPIPSPRRVQRGQILADLGDVGREAEVLEDPGVILRRMVAVGYEPDAQVLWLLELARVEDMRADFLDVACRGGYVAALASRAILDENEVAVEGRGLLVSQHVCTIGLPSAQSREGITNEQHTASFCWGHGAFLVAPALAERVLHCCPHNQDPRLRTSFGVEFRICLLRELVMMIKIPVVKCRVKS